MSAASTGWQQLVKQGVAASRALLSNLWQRDAMRARVRASERGGEGGGLRRMDGGKEGRGGERLCDSSTKIREIWKINQDYGKEK